MNDSDRDVGTNRHAGARSRGPHPAGKPFPREGRPISMHEGIAVWCDCCSCEIEPYWAEVAAEMGVDLGSDYEDGTDGGK